MTTVNIWLSVNQDKNNKIINNFIYSKLSIIFLDSFIHSYQCLTHFDLCRERTWAFCFTLWNIVCCFLALPIHVLIYATRHISHMLVFFFISVDIYIHTSTHCFCASLVNLHALQWDF